MLRGGLLLVLVVGCSGTQLAAVDRFNGLLRGSPPSSVHLQHENATNLALVADPCDCQFSGECSCDNALMFMKCIEGACGSGKCSCGPKEHGDACLAIQGKCPNAGLQCMGGVASCPAPSTQSSSLTKPATAPAEESGQKEEGKESMEEGGEGEEKASHILFYGMLATTMLLTGLVALTTSSNKVVAGNSWRVVEQVILVFVAVLWYQAFDELLDSFDLAKEHETLYHLMHAMGLLLACVAISWSLRNSKVRLTLFCGCGAHYVSFSSMAAGKVAMQHHFYHSWTMHILGLFAILGAAFVMLYIIHNLKKLFKMDKHDEWGEVISDVENDFAAMAFAVAFHLWVMHLIAGGHEGDEEYHPTWERNMMLAYAVATTVVGSLALRPLNVYADQHKENVLAKRLAMFCSSFVAMSAAWAFLRWGEWEFTQYQFQGKPLLGKLAFANLVSFTAGVALVLAARFLPTANDADSGSGWKAAMARMESILIVALSLMVAWSWEEAFDEAVEGWCEGDKNAHLHKIFLAIGMGGVILPVYGICLRPIVASYSSED